MYVHGAPAEHARHLLSRARLSALTAAVTAGFGGLLAAALVLWTLTGGPDLALAAGVGAGVFAATRAGKVSTARVAAAKAAAGVRAEDAVADVVAALRPAAVGYGLLVGAGGDADVVVAGPCLAVVEVKSGRGAVRVAGGRMQVGARAVPGDPVAQARRQAAAVRKATGEWTDAVVCVVDATGGPQRVGDVTVCSAKDLPGVLRGLQRRLGPVPAVEVVQQLAERSQQLAATVGAAPVRDQQGPRRGVRPSRVDGRTRR